MARNNKSDQKYVMFVLPGDRRFNSKIAKSVVGVKEIRFATEDEVRDITSGVLPGGVPPLGGLFGLDVYADRTLLSHEKIIFNAGDRRFSIALKSTDYLTLVNPKICSLSG